MTSMSIDQIVVGDGVRVRNRDLSFLGEVVKVNRVTLRISSSVWGNPIKYDVKKSDCVGGQIDRGGEIFTLEE